MKPKYLPFIYVPPMWNFAGPMREHDFCLDPKYTRVYFVAVDDLATKARERRAREAWHTDRVLCSLPGLLNPASKHKEYHGHYAVVYGGYYETHRLLLVDDVMEWSHHHLDFDKIRTAHSIILDMARDAST